MNMVKKLLNSKTIVTIIALVVCAIIILWAYTSRVNKKINKVTIPVAKELINAREEIILGDSKKDIKGNVESKKVANSLLSPNVIRSLDYFAKDKSSSESEETGGKYVNYNTFIPKSGMFYSSSVVDWSDMPDSAWGDISKDETILSIDLEDAAAYGNAIYPGDTIDLYIEVKDIMQDGTRKVLYCRFIEKIQVLAVKDESGNHITKRTPGSGKPKNIIFKLNDSLDADKNLFLILKSASILSEEFGIVPVPRNKDYKVGPNDVDGGTISNEQIVHMIKERSNMLMPDVFNSVPAEPETEAE